MNKPSNPDTPADSPKKPDLELTEQQEAELKRKLAELRKRDPFIYR